ncbi:uncharacterized protein LOC143146268 [Ptiloglossa arizonensis]|uniref:uncharacterized protein LOC143146268 n=1 Tax=Ptiloglossa arizonensis TaxID=3350558 RepID=UPI003FA1600A
MLRGFLPNSEVRLFQSISVSNAAGSLFVAWERLSPVDFSEFFLGAFCHPPTICASLPNKLTSYFANTQREPTLTEISVNWCTPPLPFPLPPPPSPSPSTLPSPHSFSTPLFHLPP